MKSVLVAWNKGRGYWWEGSNSATGLSVSVPCCVMQRCLESPNNSQLSCFRNSSFSFHVTLPFLLHCQANSYHFLLLPLCLLEAALLPASDFFPLTVCESRTWGARKCIYWTRTVAVVGLQGHWSRSIPESISPNAGYSQPQIPILFDFWFFVFNI